MERLLWVCAGGAIGSGCRYLVSLWALERFGGAFPYGTILVNASGSFLLGALLQVPTLTPTLRLTLGVGVLGGFTTYSSFNQETLVLAQQQQSFGLATVNVLGTLLLCLGAGWLGQLAMQAVVAK
jgi:CrcB protein